MSKADTLILIVPELAGKNGGGDPWRTDGRLAIVTLRGS
jgi:hypothetical protein